MNARRANAAAGVILAAQKQKNTAAGIAAALEAAGLLQSSESAAELVELRAGAGVADELYREWMRRAETAQNRVAELETLVSRLGARAEQRHLVDPLDHVLEHLADERAEPALEPYGCRGCGLPLPHGWQWTADQGLHLWMRPTDAQIKARMLARRSARLPAVSS